VQPRGQPARSLHVPLPQRRGALVGREGRARHVRADGVAVAHEENPALGLRGLRALRAHENILRDQLIALANAQAESEAELWVMAPMVADLEETAYFVGLAKELGLRVAGVMAEVPSLALVAEQVLGVADFVSIGTNDLTQYTLAADRLLGSLAAYQDPWHPAVLRLIKQLGDAGAAAGKAVGVCGEAAHRYGLIKVLRQSAR
jgi:phosphotransferase system enzyme I (PtsI)